MSAFYRVIAAAYVLFWSGMFFGSIGSMTASSFTFGGAVTGVILIGCSSVLGFFAGRESAGAA